MFMGIDLFFFMIFGLGFYLILVLVVKFILVIDFWIDIVFWVGVVVYIFFY